MSGIADLEGRVAVVTGAASGIGKGIATKLVAEGAQVVIADIEERALEAAAAELGAVGIRTDVSDPASVQALADATLERFGAVHVVCNNAGIGPIARVEELTLDDWRWMIDVNLWGVIHGVTTFLPILRGNAEGGHIVNTASLAGLSAVRGLGAYCVTKFGVVALTETMAQELADTNVGVSVLCPGFVRTNINNSLRNRPEGLGAGGFADVDFEGMDLDVRWLDPEDVGAMVVDAIKRGDLYVITHPEMIGPVEERHRAIMASIGQPAR